MQASEVAPVVTTSSTKTRCLPDNFPASLKPKMRMEYGDEVVEGAFEFKGGFFSSLVYTYVLGTIEIDGDEIRISPSGVTSKTGSEATPWLTRKGDKVELTMDGPHVFKGRPLERKGNKHYV